MITGASVHYPASEWSGANDHADVRIGDNRFTGVLHHVVSFTRTHDLSANRLVDTIKGIKRIAAKLMHFDGAYLRFVGDLQISRYRGGEVVETFKDEAVWELMYFGHAR